MAQQLVLSANKSLAFLLSLACPRWEMALFIMAGQQRWSLWSVLAVGTNVLHLTLVNQEAGEGASQHSVWLLLLKPTLSCGSDSPRPSQAKLLVMPFFLSATMPHSTTIPCACETAFHLTLIPASGGRLPFSVMLVGGGNCPNFLPVVAQLRLWFQGVTESSLTEDDCTVRCVLVERQPTC